LRQPLKTSLLYSRSFESSHRYMPDPVAVNSMFARIAARYDLANRLLSGGMDVWWRKRLVARVRSSHPQDVLDLATGSGDVAFALSRALPPETSITGLDFCQPMLDEAELKKAQSSCQKIAFRQGDILALPLANESYDAVTISFGLRNLADRSKGLREMHRVLRPGGRVFILEFSQPQRWFRRLYYWYLRKILPPLAGWLTGDRRAYDYLNNTIEAFPDRAAIAAEVIKAGFENVTAETMTFGVVALHRGQKSRAGA
jgi:demethylmenaquinone methyltransferase/2-methoxy-6-polyprenyl-1,4-benzoquinol methylase